MKTVQRRMNVPVPFANKTDRMSRTERNNYFSVFWNEAEGRIDPDLAAELIHEWRRYSNLVELSLRTSFGQETDADAIRRQHSILKKIFPE